MNVKKLTIASTLTAIAVVCSSIYIPLGVTKVFPIQHFVNVVAAVVLGPGYALMMALSVALIRNMLGTGSILAFPGSVFGALVSSVLYLKTRHLAGAICGEVVGTGIIGALVAWILASTLLQSQAGAWLFVGTFGLSSLAGAMLGVLGLTAIFKSGTIRNLIMNNKEMER